MLPLCYKFGHQNPPFASNSHTFHTAGLLSFFLSAVTYIFSLFFCRFSLLYHQKQVELHTFMSKKWKSKEVCKYVIGKWWRWIFFLLNKISCVHICISWLKFMKIKVTYFSFKTKKVLLILLLDFFFLVC